MAEFCLDCWNRMNGTKDTEREWVISEELDFCEECERWTRVVVRIRRPWERVLWVLTHKKKHRSE